MTGARGVPGDRRCTHQGGLEATQEEEREKEEKEVESHLCVALKPGGDR
jgi:hypothetical protein